MKRLRKGWLIAIVFTLVAVFSATTYASGTDCSSTVSPDLILHVPVGSYNGNFYTADFQIVPTSDGSKWVKLLNYTVTTQGGCNAPAILSRSTSGFLLVIPKVIYKGASYWAVLQLVPTTDGNIMLKLVNHGAGNLISGTVVKGGAVVGANVAIYELNQDGSRGSALGNGQTDSAGSFNVILKSQPSGPIEVAVDGGTYISRYDGKTVSSKPLSSLFSSVPASGLNRVAVTPLSDMVASLAKGFMATGSNDAAKGAEYNIDRATNWINGIYNLQTGPQYVIPNFDKNLITTKRQETQVGIVLGALDTLANTLSPTDPDSVLKALSEDISDGVFDGKKSGKPLTLPSGTTLPADAGVRRFLDSLAMYTSAYEAGLFPKYTTLIPTPMYTSSSIPVYAGLNISPYDSSGATKYQQNVNPLANPHNQSRHAQLAALCCLTGDIPFINIAGYPVCCAAPGTLDANNQCTGYVYTQNSLYCAGPAACTDWTYSAWSACDASGVQSRTVIGTIPAGCTGTPSILQQLTQICTPPPAACTDYTYSPWSACVNGQQIRTVIGNIPAGCTGTPSIQPQLTQSCTAPPAACTDYTYSPWSACVNGQQTRTVIGNIPAGCTGTPSTATVLTQACTPPPAESCLNGYSCAVGEGILFIDRQGYESCCSGTLSANNRSCSVQPTVATYTGQCIAAATITVVNQQITGDPFNSNCSTPVGKTVYSPTDSTVNFWVYFTTGVVGDTIKFQFFAPDNSLYSTTKDTLTFSGGGCDAAGILISGQKAATLPGQWRVDFYLNGALAATGDFTIGNVQPPTPNPIYKPKVGPITDPNHTRGLTAAGGYSCGVGEGILFNDSQGRPYCCSGALGYDTQGNLSCSVQPTIAAYTAQPLVPYSADMITPFHANPLTPDIAKNIVHTTGNPGDGTIPVYTSVTDIHVFTPAERAQMNQNSNPNDWPPQPDGSTGGTGQGPLTQLQIDVYSILNHNIPVWFSGDPFSN